MSETEQNNFLVGDNKGRVDLTRPLSEFHTAYSLPSDELSEGELTEFHLTQANREKTLALLTDGSNSEVISYLEQEGGFVPMFARKRQDGSITYIPGYAVHGITGNEQELSALGMLIRDGTKRTVPSKSGGKSSHTPFTDLVGILKTGLSGIGSENITVYHSNEDTYHSSRHFAKKDQDQGAKFLIQFQRFYPSRMGRFIHQKMPSFDRYQPSNDTVNYAHFVKPEDISVIVAYDTPIPDEEVATKQQHYSDLLSEQVGRTIKVEIVNKPQDYLKIDWDKARQSLEDQSS